MSNNRGYLRFLAGGETRCYATALTPSGILAGVLKALEHHGVNREQAAKYVDLKSMEQAFAAIDERAFRRLLTLSNYHPQQIVVVEAQDKVEFASAAETRDQGTLFGLTS